MEKVRMGKLLKCSENRRSTNGNILILGSKVCNIRRKKSTIGRTEINPFFVIRPGCLPKRSCFVGEKSTF